MASKQTLIDAYLSGLDSNVKADIDVSSGKRLITDTPTLATKSTVVDADVGSILKAKKAAEEKAAKAAAAAAAKAQKAAQKAAEKAAKAAEKAAAAQSEEDAIAAEQSGKKTGATGTETKTATGTKTTTKTAAKTSGSTAATAAANNASAAKNTKNAANKTNPWNTDNSNGVTKVLDGITNNSGKTSTAGNTKKSTATSNISAAKNAKKEAKKESDTADFNYKFAKATNGEYALGNETLEMVLQPNGTNAPNENSKAAQNKAAEARTNKEITDTVADMVIKENSGEIRNTTTKEQAEADYATAKKQYKRNKTQANKKAMDDAKIAVDAFLPENDANVTIQGTSLTGEYDATAVENGKTAEGNPTRVSAAGKTADGATLFDIDQYIKDSSKYRNVQNPAQERAIVNTQMENLSDEERDYINYLYGSYDRKTAAKLTATYFNNKENEEIVETAKNEKNIFYDIANAGGAIAGMQGASLPYLVELGANTVKNITNGDNNAVPLYSPASQNMARTQAKQTAFVETDDNTTGQFLRSTGLSILQNIANMPVNIASGGTVGLLNMASQAAASDAFIAAAEGKTGTQQVLKALQSGATEYFTEKIPFENLKNLFNSAGTKTISGLISGIGKQMAEEFGEEAASEAIGIVYDFMSDCAFGNMTYEQWADQYKDELYKGDVGTAASLNLAGNILSQIAQAGAAGALSGAVMGGGGTLIGVTANRNAANESAYNEAAQRYANAENGVYGQNGAFYDGSADAENMAGRNNQFLAYVKKVGENRAEATAPVVESAPVTENVQTADETTTDRPRKISEIPYEEIVQHYHEGTMTDNDIKALRGNNEYRLRFMEDTNVTLPSTFSKTKDFLQNKNVKTSSSEYDELNTLIEKANAGTLTIQERKRILQMKGLWESTTGVKIPDTNNQVVKFFDKPVAVSARISDNSSAQRIAYDLRSQTRYDAEKVKSVFARHGISISDGAAKSISITLQNTENNAALLSEVEKAVYSGEMRKKATANKKTVQAVKPAETAKTAKPVAQTTQQTTAQPTLAAVQNTQEAATQNSTENQGQLLDLQSQENYNTGKEVITDATEAENGRSGENGTVSQLPGVGNEDLSAKKNPFKVKEVKTQSNTVDALLENSGKTYEDMIPAEKLNGVNGVLNGITEDSANGLYRYGVSQLAVDEVKKAIRSGASAEDIKAIVYEDLVKGTHTVYTDKQALQEARDAVETPGGVDATYNNIKEKTESNQTLNATEVVEGIALYDALSQELKAADDGSKESVAEKMRYVARALAKSASETGLALQKTQLASVDPVIAVEKIATEIENVFAEENKGSDAAAKKAADVLYEEWVNVSDATQKTAEIKDIMRAVRKIARENGASLTQKGVRNVAKLVAKGATAADIYTTIVNDMTGYSPLSAEEIGDINERMREAQQKADIYGAQSNQVNDVLDYVYNKVIAEHFAGRQSGLSALAYANMLSAPTTMNRNLFGNIVNGMATESNYRLSRLFDAAFDKVMKRKGADYDRTTGKRASRQMVGEAYNYIDHVAGLLEDNNSQKPKDRINRALGQKMKPSKTVIGDLAKKMVKGYSDLVSTPLDATDKKGLIGLLNVVDALGDNGVAKSLQSAVENIQQTDAKVKGYGYIGLAGLYNNFARYASNYLAAHGYGEGAFAEYETERRKVNLSNRLLGDSSISEQLRAVGDMRGADSYDDVIRAEVREYYNMDNATLNEAIRDADSDSILSLFKDSSDFRDFVKEAYQNKRYKPNAIYTDGNKAIAFGVDMAKKATFHTDSLVARQMNKMKNIKGPVGFLFSGILPFVKTPVNVTATAYRNSWIGLLQSTVEMISHAKNGALTYTDAQNMAAGVRGGLMNTALGLLLSLTGVLSGKDRDDKEGKYKKAIFGEQGYTLNLFGQKYSIDWLLQSDPGLLVGATLGDKIKDGTEVDDLESGFNNAFDFVASAVDPVFGGTMLSGISDTIGRSANSQSGNILLEMMFQNLFTKGKQLLTPAYMGKIASGIAGTRKSTYSEYSGAFKSVDQFITYVKSRWPFTVNDVNDYIDCWGNKQSTYGMIYQMYSPGYYGNNISTKTDEELMRLYGVTNDTSVIPGTASTQAHNEIVGTDLNGNDIKESRKLTKDEYQKFAEERGQAAYRMITDLQESSEYKYLTDTEKAELTSSLFDIASDIGYRKANKNFAINNKVAYSIYEEYGEEGVVTYLIAKKNIESQYNSAKENGVERKQVMLDYVSGMNDSDKIMIASQYNDGVGFISENYGDTAALEYLDMLSYADADGNGAINQQEALVYLKHNNVSEPGLLWWKATGNAKAGQAYKTSGLAGVNALYNEKVGK